MMHFQVWKEKYFNQSYVVAFDPIKIFTYQAPQNDRPNLSFVKDLYLGAKKLAKNGRKMTINELYISSFFLTKLKIKGKEKKCDLCCSFWSN